MDDNSDLPALPVKGFPTMFGTLKEKNVTFVIDTSGSMYSKLESIKEHLIEVLLNHAIQGKECLFNIVEFSSEVTQWADKMVKCNPKTVAVAAEWLKHVTPKTGTNTLDALLAAYEDKECEGVYLVTDGMPDQHTDEILDHVNYAWQGRPVHSYYISGRTSDQNATKFLQELATETYGSFHVVSVTNHGCIERVSPIFRSDHSSAKFLRTTRGAIFPNNKACSVTTTLAGDPLLDFNYIPYPQVMIDDVTSLPMPFMFPRQHYYYYHPYYAWSRYRPARGWMKKNSDKTEVGDEGLSPAAGALLVGKQVLARRDKDGYYYRGTVKSQIENDQFLVELGPCKHGDFIETEYQETMVYDLISYVDSLRHAVVPGDKILATWQPEGEQYAPGVVIEGMERRSAETGTDQQVTVTFCNGRTEKVPLGTAVWIPNLMYDRIALELKMPEKARKYLEKTVKYPLESKPGYPTSGPFKDPVDYTCFKPAFYEDGEVLIKHGALGYPHYTPIYPVMRKYIPSESTIPADKTSSNIPVTYGIRSDDLASLIPGTDLTQSELNDKIMSQLAAHQLKLDEIADGTSRLLNREQEDTNKITVDAAKKEDKDDGNEVIHESKADSGVEDDDFDFDDVIDIEDAQTQTEPIFRKKHKNTTEKRPPWKNYWPPYATKTNLRAPPYHEPYQDTNTPGYIELRRPPTGSCGVEWGDSMFHDTPGYNSRLNFDPDLMYKVLSNMPRPPAKPERQVPGKDFTSQGCHQDTIDRLEAARKEYKRNQTIKRLDTHSQKQNEQDNMKSMIRDFHRARILEQINCEKQRQQKEWTTLQNTREAKKQINDQIRHRIEDKQQWEQSRAELRSQAARSAKQHRFAVWENRNRDIAKAMELKKQNNLERQQVRWAEVQPRLNTEYEHQVAAEKIRHNAKINRINHYRQIETSCQRERLYKYNVADMHNGILRSQVLQ